jgi:hypothetical protein
LAAGSSTASARDIFIHLHRPRGPPDWIDADEQVFLDEDLDQDRYEIEFDQRLTWQRSP